MCAMILLASFLFALSEVETETLPNGRDLAAASDIVLGGSVEMKVLDIDDFLSDHYAQYAVGQGIAEIANVNMNYVDVSTQRYYDTSEGVQANYTISIPSTVLLTPSTVSSNLDTVTVSQLEFIIRGYVRKVAGENFTISVSSKSFVMTASSPVPTTMAPASYTLISGKLWLIVPDAAAFKLDNYAQYAVAQSLAEAALVPVSYVQLSATLARRLADSDTIDFNDDYGRRVLGTVEVDFVIIVPSSFATSASDIRNRLETTTIAQMDILLRQQLAKVKESSYINVTSVTSKGPVTSQLSATTLTTTPFRGSLSGKLNLTVPDVYAFLNDHYAQYAVAQGIAQVAELSVNEVELTARFLRWAPVSTFTVAGDVEISYTLIVPTAGSVTTLTVSNKMLAASLSAMTAAIRSKLVLVNASSYVVTVIGKTSSHTAKAHKAPTYSDVDDNMTSENHTNSNSQPWQCMPHILGWLLAARLCLTTNWL